MEEPAKRSTQSAEVRPFRLVSPCLSCGQRPEDLADPSGWSRRTQARPVCGGKGAYSDGLPVLAGTVIEEAPNHGRACVLVVTAVFSFGPAAPY
jgi:hypothetical protein